MTFSWLGEAKDGGHKVRFLSSQEVIQALPMADAVQAMKEAFAQLSAGEAVAPPRTHIAAADEAGDALFMPSYAPKDGRMGLKIVTIYNGNEKLGLPRIQAVVVVVDATNGSPVAIMDGTSLTAIRTGAASGAATDLMAREDADTVAIFGAGVQARTQLEAVCAVRTIAEARVFSPIAGQGDAFAAAMCERLNVSVKAVDSPSQALSGADVVCTATTATVPVFRDEDLEPGVHLNAIGSYKPEVREIPGETVKRSRIVVDHLPAALEEAGDLIIPLQEGLIRQEDLCAELGEIAAGQKTGRGSPDEVTLFKSVGIAVQDLAAASKLLANAEQLGLGTELSL